MRRGVLGQASARNGHVARTSSARNDPDQQSDAVGANRIYNVLFLCTGNSARSIMAECALRRWGGKQFQAFSAGSHPLGHVHPLTLELLRDFKYPTEGLRSKSWDEFAQPDGPPLDFVFTVCDKAAGEACPIWPGQPMTAHWGVEDPAGYAGPEDKQRAFFRRIYTELEARVKLFTSLPLDSIDSMTLQHRLDDIGRR
jgi:arsenate reductase